MTDLQHLLKQRGVPDSAVLAQPIAGPAEVLSQLAATDFVVASRFHNVLLALMLNKPVVSISYHDKVDALMAGFGLATFCQDIERFDLDTLTAQLTMLEQDATNLKPRIQQTADAYRDALDNQYERIVTIVAA
jgi:polysaccharide pyruvyl transferase WcaK-like protein